MIFTIKKDDFVIEVDDLVLFNNQSVEFKKLYNTNKIVEIKDEDGNITNSYINDNVEFDNCYVEVNEFGRLIINNKIEDVTI